MESAAADEITILSGGSRAYPHKSRIRVMVRAAGKAE
jgi:hypothetical protein